MGIYDLVWRDYHIYNEGVKLHEEISMLLLLKYQYCVVIPVLCCNTSIML